MHTAVFSKGNKNGIPSKAPSFHGRNNRSMAFSRKQDWIGVGRWCKGQGAHGRGGFILVGGQNLKEAFALEAVLKPFNVLIVIYAEIVRLSHGSME